MIYNCRRSCDCSIIIITTDSVTFSNYECSMKFSKGDSSICKMSSCYCTICNFCGCDCIILKFCSRNSSIFNTILQQAELLSRFRSHSASRRPFDFDIYYSGFVGQVIVFGNSDCWGTSRSACLYVLIASVIVTSESAKWSVSFSKLSRVARSTTAFSLFL